MARSPIGILVAVACVIGCTSTPSPHFDLISCQPYGYTPAPVTFSFPPGPLTSAAAEQTAVAFFRACGDPASTITEVTSTSDQAAGQLGGPNAGEAVWRVKVDATISAPAPGAVYISHWIIEVNQTTGKPTVVAYG
jgi:hypothetical protein